MTKVIILAIAIAASIIEATPTELTQEVSRYC